MSCGAANKDPTYICAGIKHKLVEQREKKANEGRRSGARETSQQTEWRRKE